MSYDGRLIADARHLPIADESVQCVVTSPPYWGLRDYGNSEQIGLEKTPDEYVNSLVMVFREVWRALKFDGVMWLNLGDSYVGSGMTDGTNSKEASAKREDRMFRGNRRDTVPGLKQKDLAGIPWRVAFALQADGWWLRSDMVWNKPNPMPESVTDRPTRSHEYIFLLTKSERYFYDAAAIRESAQYVGPNGAGTQKGPYAQGFGRRTPEQEQLRQDKQRGHSRRHAGFNDRWDLMSKEEQSSFGRNKRSVWTIATQPYPGSHYATFPEEIPDICIRAGSRPGDVVLDPFFGSGTVGRVAERLSRRWIGCDLGYQDLQAKRLTNIQKVLVESEASTAGCEVSS